MSSKEEAIIDGKPISSLRVVDLKSELELRGLSKSGSKKELMDRLRKQIELEVSRRSSSNDEEHVPNLSLNEDDSLAENDFVRDYLASQQAIYQKEREAKKIFEEERAKESESAGDTTQDEEEAEPRPKDTEQSSTPESPKPPRLERSTPIHPKKRELSRIASEEAAEEQEKRNPKKMKDNTEDDVVMEEESQTKSTAEDDQEIHSSPPDSGGGAEPTIEQETPSLPTMHSPSKAQAEDTDGKKADVAEEKAEVTMKDQQHEDIDSKKSNVTEEEGEVMKDHEDVDSKKADVTEEKGEVTTKDEGRTEQPTDIDEKKEEKGNQESLEQPRKLKRLSNSTEEFKEKNKDKRASPKKESRQVDKPSRRDASKHEEESGHTGSSAAENEQTSVIEAVAEDRTPKVGSDLNRETEETKKEEEIESRDKSEPSMKEEKSKSAVSSAGEGGEKLREDGKLRKLKRERHSDIYVPPGKRMSDEKKKELENLEKTKEQKQEGPKQSERLPPVTIRKEAQQAEKKQEEGELELNYGDIEDSDEDKEEPMETEAIPETTGAENETELTHDKGQKRSLATSANDDDEPYTKLVRVHQPGSPKPLRRPLKETVEERTALRRPKAETLEQEKSEKKQELVDEQSVEIDWSSFKVRKLKNFLSGASTSSSEREPVQKRVPPLVEESVISELIMIWYPDVTILPEEEENVSHAAMEEEPEIVFSPEVPPAETDVLPNKNRRVVSEVDYPETEKPEVEGPALPEKKKPEVLGTVRQATTSKAVVTPSDRPMSPPRAPVSSVLSVMNLTRPFTIAQLKELLGRTGQLVNGGFWTDRIKSRCLVEYSSVEEAMTTRDALHGVKWPAGNPKLLFVDFSTKESLENHLRGIEERIENAPQPRPRVPAAEKKEGKKGVRTEEEANKVATMVKQWNSAQLFQQYNDEMKGKEGGKPQVLVTKDLFKQYNDDMKERERLGIGNTTNYQRERGQREQEKRDRDNDRHAKKGSGEMLDDLFRKTGTKPSLYFVSLTKEQIAEKEARRQMLQDRRPAAAPTREQRSPSRRRHSPTPEKRRRSPHRNGDRSRSRSPPPKSETPRRRSPPNRDSKSPQRRRRRSSSPPRRR